jgi:antitoxin component YwqK of YwqJK toxin-antitoxin module
MIEGFMSKLTTLMILGFSIMASTRAETELPHGCGTFIICDGKKDANGEPDGDQTCRNADNKKTIVITAHWKKGQLERDFFCANDDGVPVAKANYKNGKLDGKYQEYDSSLKQWAKEEFYKDGKRDGISKTLLPNGKTIVKYFKNDQHNGFELLLDPAGQLVAKKNCHVDGNYAEDKVCDAYPIPGYEALLANTNDQERKKKQAQDNRVVEDKYPDGTLRERYKLVAGKKQGLYERFYRNGKLGEKYTLVDDIKDGGYEAFYESGTLEQKTLYRRGVKLEDSHFFKEGQIEQTTWFKDSAPYKIINFYQNGKVAMELIEQDAGAAKNGSRIAVKRFHDNGQAAETSFLRKRENQEWAERNWGSLPFDGVRELFSSSGKLVDHEEYDNGVRIGTWKSWTSKFDFEIQYQNDVKQSLTIFDKNHKQLKRSEYFPDGSIRKEVVEPGFKEGGE